MRGVRFVLVAVLVVAIGVSGTVMGARPTEPAVAWPALVGVSVPASHRYVTVAEYTRLLRQVWRIPKPGGYGGDYHVFGGHERGRRRLARLRALAGDRVYVVMRERTTMRKRRWRLFRHVDELTDNGEWSIPSYIPRCESGWNYHVGFAGAYGLVQAWSVFGGPGLIVRARHVFGEDQPWSFVDANHAPAWAQHIVAARAEAGGAYWECR